MKTSTTETLTVSHSPLPWVVGDDHPSVCRITEDGQESLQIAAMDTSPFGLSEAHANAAFIARACNSHAALVAQRDDMLQLLGVVAQNLSAGGIHASPHGCVALIKDMISRVAKEGV